MILFDDKNMISGGGGVGKSFLIEVISQAADRIFRKMGDNPKRPKVILAAPTGIAAMLIGTNTHLLFMKLIIFNSF